MPTFNGVDSATERVVRSTRSPTGKKSESTVTGGFLEHEDIAEMLEEQDQVSASGDSVLAGPEASRRYIDHIDSGGVSAIVGIGDVDMFSFRGLDEPYDDSLGCEINLRRYARSWDERAVNGRKVASYTMYVPNF